MRTVECTFDLSELKSYKPANFLFLKIFLIRESIQSFTRPESKPSWSAPEWEGVLTCLITYVGLAAEATLLVRVIVVGLCRWQDWLYTKIVKISSCRINTGLFPETRRSITPFCWVFGTWYKNPRENYVFMISFWRPLFFKGVALYSKYSTVQIYYIQHLDRCCTLCVIATQFFACTAQVPGARTSRISSRWIVVGVPRRSSSQLPHPLWS